MCYEGIPRTYLFSGKLSFLKPVLFLDVNGLYSNMLNYLNPCKCGAAVTHKISVFRNFPRKSWNPNLC